MGGKEGTATSSLANRHSWWRCGCASKHRRREAQNKATRSGAGVHARRALAPQQHAAPQVFCAAPQSVTHPPQVGGPCPRRAATIGLNVCCLLLNERRFSASFKQSRLGRGVAAAESPMAGTRQAGSTCHCNARKSSHRYDATGGAFGFGCCGCT
jgi:hypothetical protein